MFMGLDMISDYVPDLQSNPEMFAFLERYASMGFASVLLFMFVGMIITAVIQSSAATFAIVLIMCTKGWISFDLACAVVLGSNIGTTITPLLASMRRQRGSQAHGYGPPAFQPLRHSSGLLLCSTPSSDSTCTSPSGSAGVILTASSTM